MLGLGLDSLVLLDHHIRAVEIAAEVFWEGMSIGGCCPVTKELEWKPMISGDDCVFVCLTDECRELVCPDAHHCA